MTSPGIFINSIKHSTGYVYDGTWNFSNDVQGYYNVVYTHLGPGDVPICYEGVNALVVIRNSNSASTVIHFDDLSSDTPADVETWLETGFGDLLGDLGVTITSATAVDGGKYYDLVFDLSVTLKFSSSSSSLSKLFGSSDLSGTTIRLSGINIDNRPKFLAVCIQEGSQIYATTDLNNVSCLLSTQDDLVKGAIVYIPNETSSLNIKVVRLNAPSIPVPIDIRWSIILQRTFNSTFTG